jgi:TatD DNase family protein
MLFDTHAHYYASAFNEDRDEVLSSLPGEGVGLVLCPGNDLWSSHRCIEMAEQYPYIYAAAGIHPEDALNLPEDWLAQIEEMAAHPKVKAIGEIGLDYYWKEVPHDLQKEVFRAQLALAEKLDLPVIVHDREAHADCLAIVKEFPKVRGVFHCYSGSAEDAKTLVKLGWYLGFNGAVTFKNAKKAPEVAAWVPADRLLVETDAPYLAPVPHRGKRCDSAMISHVLDFLASIRPESREELERITWENALRFYNL